MLSDRDRTILSKTLTYANGYRELAMFDHALEELDTLDQKLQAQKEHHQMRLAVLMDAKRWTDALPFANRLACNESNDPGHLINLAFVTRRANSIEGARVILENAAKRFPEEALIQYNLGCYACCRDEMDTAKEYLRQAFRLDPAFIKTAAKDEDLANLKEWISTFSKTES